VFVRFMCVNVTCVTQVHVHLLSAHAARRAQTGRGLSAGDTPPGAAPGALPGPGAAMSGAGKCAGGRGPRGTMATAAMSSEGKRHGQRRP